MIPGLPPLPPHMAVHQQHLQTLLQQAWLSRATTSVTNSFTPSAFPFPNPFLPLPPVTTSPETVQKRYEEAEDLSSLSSKRFKSDQAVCPICNIALKWEELPDHFQTELKCLDNIRALSPIARPVSSSSSYRPSSSSPNKSLSLSLSPTSPGYAESRWQRFQRIRSKRRERVGAKQEARGGREAIKEQLEAVGLKQEDQEDIDIGDSGSDCGSASDSESCQTFGPLQYSEADVLRCLSEDKEENAENTDIMDSSEDENANSKTIACPTCRGVMRVPVLNTSCWHLKCEKCWLRAVGTKKCCSVCSRSASVKELRKVHL